MANLEDAVVVVTGAGRGIGRAIAEELGDGGACIVANYAKSASAAEEVVAQLRANGARAVRFLIVDGDYITGSALDINGGIICEDV